MKNIKKQILLIAYTFLAIVAGLLLTVKFDSFTFMVPILPVSMLSIYFLCWFEERANWQGCLAYVLVNGAAWYITSTLIQPMDFDNTRLFFIKLLTILFAILGSLSGGILRYKMEQLIKKERLENPESVTEISEDFELTEEENMESDSNE